MLCDKCGKKEAVAYTAVNINNHVSEMHLCDECYKKYGGLTNIWDAVGAGLGTLFGGFSADKSPAAKKQQLCPKCGTTFDEFLKTSYLGCENCYKEFAASLRPVIMNTQGKLQHVGKIPNPTEEDNVRREYQRLQRDLQQAVAEERYEEAASIKRAISELDKGGAIL